MLINLSVRRRVVCTRLKNPKVIYKRDISSVQENAIHAIVGVTIKRGFCAQLLIVPRAPRLVSRFHCLQGRGSPLKESRLACIRVQARLILRCHAPCIRSHPARGTCRASASMREAAIPAVSVASRSAARRHGCRTLVDARQPSVGGRLAEWTAKTAVHSPPLSPSADAFTPLPRMSDASPLTGFGLRPQVRRRD